MESRVILETFLQVENFHNEQLGRQNNGLWILRVRGGSGETIPGNTDLAEIYRMRWFDNITDSVDTNLSKLRETVDKRGAWRAVVAGVNKESDMT